MDQEEVERSAWLLRGKTTLKVSYLCYPAEKKIRLVAFLSSESIEFISYFSLRVRSPIYISIKKQVRSCIIERELQEVL